MNFNQFGVVTEAGWVISYSGKGREPTVPMQAAITVLLYMSIIADNTVAIPHSLSPSLSIEILLANVINECMRRLTHFIQIKYYK